MNLYVNFFFNFFLLRNCDSRHIGILSNREQKKSSKRHTQMTNLRSGFFWLQYFRRFIKSVACKVWGFYRQLDSNIIHLMKIVKRSIWMPFVVVVGGLFLAKSLLNKSFRMITSDLLDCCVAGFGSKQASEWYIFKTIFLTQIVNRILNSSCSFLPLSHPTFKTKKNFQFTGKSTIYLSTKC